MTLGAGVMAACGAERVPQDVLVVGQVAEPRSMDPHAVTSLNDFRILVNIYDGLVRFKDGTLEVEPALAESWDVTPDGRAYTFHLRSGIAFHDGTPLDAEAVRFNIERMLDEDHPQHDTGPFPLAFMLEAISRVVVVDERTVRFELNEPYAPLLSNLAYPIGLLVSPEAVRQHGADYGRHPSGTGPFAFRTWESRRQVVLERYPEHWNGAPRLRSVIFRPITDPVTRVRELTTGGLDLIVEVPPDEVAALRDAAAFTVHEAVGPHLWFVVLNTRQGPFRDRRVRQAVNYAVDKHAIVEDLLQGTATVAAGPIPEAFAWAHNPDVAPYPHDPARARALLDSAGHTNGFEATFLVTQGGSGMLSPVQMATAIQANLAEVGIDASIETYEWNTYLGNVNDGLSPTEHMAEMAWMTNDPHILPALALRSDAWPDSGGFNSGYYANPEVDRLLTEARGTTDRDARARLYRRIQQVVHRDAPWIFVASWKQNAVTNADVHGFDLQPSFFLRLDDTYQQ